MPNSPRPLFSKLLTRLVPACASALIVALTGCAPEFSQGGTVHLATTGTRAAAATAAAPAAAGATSVCASVPSCRRVATVDVDGDGRPDQVGISAHHISAHTSASHGSITVRVRTATGHTLTTTSSHVIWFSKPFLGAAALDGRRGAEIVVGDTMGANYEQFRVITYRHHKLVTLDEPPLAWTGKGMADAATRWGVDGSYSFNIGIFRSVDARHVVTLTLKTFERNATGRGHTGHVTVYRWHRGAWVERSSRRLQLADKRAFAVGGWHVSGLRRFG